MIERYSGSLDSILRRVEGWLAWPSSDQVLVELDPKTLDILPRPRRFLFGKGFRYLVTKHGRGQARFVIFLSNINGSGIEPPRLECMAEPAPNGEQRLAWSLAGPESPLERLKHYLQGWIRSGNFGDRLRRSKDDSIGVLNELAHHLERNCRSGLGLDLEIRPLTSSSGANQLVPTGERAAVNVEGPTIHIAPMIFPSELTHRETSVAQSPPETVTVQDTRDASFRKVLEKLRREIHSIEAKVPFLGSGEELEYSLRFSVIESTRWEYARDLLTSQETPLSRVSQAIEEQLCQLLSGEDPGDLKQLSDRHLSQRISEELCGLIADEVGLRIKIHGVRRLADGMDRERRVLREAKTEAEAIRVKHVIQRTREAGQHVDDDLFIQMQKRSETILDLEKRRLMLVKSNDDVDEIERLEKLIEELKQEQLRAEKALEQRRAAPNSIFEEGFDPKAPEPVRTPESDPPSSNDGSDESAGTEHSVDPSPEVDDTTKEPAFVVPGDE